MFKKPDPVSRFDGLTAARYKKFEKNFGFGIRTSTTLTRRRHSRKNLSFKGIERSERVPDKQVMETAGLGLRVRKGES